MAPLEIRGLSKAFRTPGGARTPALAGVSLQVAAGELLAVLGPSGSGKSTLLRCLAGLETPEAGTVTLAGQPLLPLPPHQREVALVGQHPVLFPHLNVFENLAFGLRMRHTEEPEIRRRVAEAAGQLDLAALLERRPETLSGGERQRVALGRALVRQPKLFLFDEPLSSLDAPLRAQLRAVIARLHRQCGATTLYVTHDQVEALSLGHRVAVMHQGAVRQTAPPREIYDAPADAFVAGFVGAPPMNLLAVEIMGGSPPHLRQHGESLTPPPAWWGEATAEPSPVGNQRLLGIRPEHLALTTATGGEVLRVVVELSETLGPETILRCQWGRQALAVRLNAPVFLAPGSPAALAVDWSRARLFDPPDSPTSARGCSGQRGTDL